jgi:two-component system sensor kinase FixL
LTEFLNVDRSSLGQFTPDGRLTFLHSYAVEGIPALPRGELGVSLDWYVGQLARGRVVHVPSVGAVPRRAVGERAFMRTSGMKSHLGIPVDVGGTPPMPPFVLGIATFAREREFPEELIPRLRLAGSVFANALLRRDTAHNLRRMQAELAHVTRVSTVGQLATSIAHEINQPLCAIISNAQAAQRLLARPAAAELDAPDAARMADVRAALRDIAADGRRAADVIARSHDLLKRHDPEFRPLSINDVVADVFAMVHSDAVIRRVMLRTVPAGEPLPRVLGDRVQLQQVVLNLIVNALEATADTPLPRGNEPRQVTVRTMCTEGRAGVRVVVEDTGPGLTPEVAARMFEPFFTTKRHGLGMGLAINQSIVQAHGGSMGASAAAAAEARTGAARGAVVWFELPALDEAGPKA